MTIVTESAREHSAYAARIRRSNERLAFAVAGFLALTAGLPVTRDRDRVGVLLCALGLLALAVVWFRVIPAGAFGDRRVMAFGLLAQPLIAVLLAGTGGLRSQYFPFAILLVTVTVFSPRVLHTVVVALLTVPTLTLVALVDSSSVSVAAGLGTWIIELIGFALVAGLIGRTLRASRSAIAARADELEALRGRAETLALTDTLTGLYNRRYATDALQRLIADAQRGRTFSIASFDLDGFKALNDARGHAAGDDVLIAFARVLRAGLRGADIAVRTGGDEFIALLPNTTRGQAILVTERLRAAALTAGWGAPEAIVTVSTGVVEWGRDQSAADVLDAADRELYVAKRARSA